MFLDSAPASAPMIETMTEWKPLTASTLASTICNCLNFHKAPKMDEIARPKLITLKDITGET